MNELRAAGARVEIISQQSEPIQAFKHHQPTIFAHTRHHGVVVGSDA